MTTKTTRARKKIFIAITDHGFGHLAQLSPWLNHPRTQATFDFTLHISLTPTQIKQLVTAPHDHHCATSDPGIAMKDALRVNPQATYAQYRAHFDNRQEHLLRTVQLIKKEKPDLILSNVGWTALLAAQALHIPNFATSSSNWSDLFFHYCGHYPFGKQISDAILSAYHNANGFIKLTPGMSMSNLNGPRLGIIGRVGRKQILSHNNSTNNPPSKKETAWVLVSPGGMPLDLSPDNWPRHPNIQWIFTGQTHPTHRADMHTPTSLGKSFIDILASVDAIITKPGYGTFVEAALHGCPVLFIRRPDWPEQESLIQWLATQVPSASMCWQTFQASGWLPTLMKLMQAPNGDRHREDRMAESENTIANFSEILIQAAS